ncbi:MAG: tRNA (adenosine(37)-N6)-threonylcarbamoyltransferase complex dimerization subunit type 1 TsaB, partial [Pseudomonadota bacterium]
MSAARPLTLAIDTALKTCQAAVIDGDAVLGASSAPAKGDAEAIATHVDKALAAAGREASALGAIAVTVGPGSFTGVRVGIAYAKGIGFALNVPVRGAPTLEVMARAAMVGPTLAVIDARHGAVFAGLFLAPDAPAHTLARLDVEACATLARAHGAQVVGEASAIAALGLGGVREH